MKKCIVCNEIKEEMFFRNKHNQCKECEKIRAREYYYTHKIQARENNKQWRENHPRAEYCKQWRKDNKEKVENYRKEYYQNNKEYYVERKKNNLDKVVLAMSKWRKDKGKEWERNKKNNDPLYRLKCQIRNTILKSFKRKKYSKNQHTQEIIGCSVEELIKYLHITFKNNYGYEWDGIEPVHIDHIKPLVLATTEDEILELCHYTNLQLLKAKDNLKKGSKYDRVATI